MDAGGRLITPSRLAIDAVALALAAASGVAADGQQVAVAVKACEDLSVLPWAYPVGAICAKSDIITGLKLVNSYVVFIVKTGNARVKTVALAIHAQLRLAP